MLTSRARISGHACIGAAFPAGVLRGLPEAIAALEPAPRVSVVPGLIGALDPQRWRSSRSAVSGLRAQGRSALCAAPAIASWLKLCIDGGLPAQAQYGLNDALHVLTTFRGMLAEPDPSAPPEAPERISAFLDGVFQPYLLSLLVPPVRYWQRGVVDYVRGLHGDLEATATTLQRFEVTLRETSGGSAANDEWDDYTHSETVATIGELGPHLERLRIEREWREQPVVPLPVAEPVEPEPGEPAEPCEQEQTVPWAVRELAAPSVSRRLAACRVIQRMGRQAEAAVPALRSMLSRLDDETAPAVVPLRDEARAALQAITPPAPVAAWADRDVEDEVSAEAVARLLALASDDDDSRVRTAALYALANIGTRAPDVLAIALRAADAEDPQERIASAQLLATLAR